MKPSTLKSINPILVALITASTTLAVAFINKPSPQPNISTNPIPQNPSNLTNSECHPILANKVCVAHLTVQINSDEPQQVKYSDRLPLQTGDTIKLLNLTYCIPPQIKVNKLTAKAHLFKNGNNNYQNVLLTSSSFPTNTGCHNVSNFQDSWQLAAGQHRVNVPIMKYEGSYRVVDQNFSFNLDVGE
ncbi:hypothetical protein [Nostoc sp. CMAA1605]|uniref:hypothetical protein n=1 Tax=Nostoc sp. CMAA1605 TaxID=2055159 RepID=UPI001F480142|nr:hypothetical protein [Nostoc sp. CMAA1605]MCF4969948.1 hypothetical protein [Nostoc sp. CMAA1605]